MGIFFKNVVIAQKLGLFMAIMPQDKEVDWRTCPCCEESYPWRADVPKAFSACQFCLSVGYLEERIVWRTCPTCKGKYPWRADTHSIWRTCITCRMTEAQKTAVALANAGPGAGFGHQGGKR